MSPHGYSLEPHWTRDTVRPSYGVGPGGSSRGPGRTYLANTVTDMDLTVWILKLTLLYLINYP